MGDSRLSSDNTKRTSRQCGATERYDRNGRDGGGPFTRGEDLGKKGSKSFFSASASEEADGRPKKRQEVSRQEK